MDIIPFYRRRTGQTQGGGYTVYHIGGYITPSGQQYATVSEEGHGRVYSGELVEGHPFAYPVVPTPDELGITSPAD